MRIGLIWLTVGTGGRQAYVNKLINLGFRCEMPEFLGRLSKCKLDFKLPPCFECRMLSSGLFPGACNLNANVSEHSVCSIFIGE
jgi:hypothetical protein